MKNVMKFLIGILFLNVSILNAKDQQLRFDVGDTLYVCAYNGINLRSEANTSSEVITKLDHAKQVVVLETASNLIEIDHRKSIWMKVSSNGYTGYLFGGYLSAIEPLYLESYSFDCNTGMYYLDWVSDIIGGASPVLNQSVLDKQKKTGGEVSISTYHSYQNGDLFYNKVGPFTDSYYFESQTLTYNDVLNFMEYMVACQNRFCNSQDEYGFALFRPIKNRHGQLVRVDCTTPLAMTAKKQNGKMVVKLETCL